MLLLSHEFLSMGCDPHSQFNNLKAHVCLMNMMFYAH